MPDPTRRYVVSPRAGAEALLPPDWADRIGAVPDVQIEGRVRSRLTIRATDAAAQQLTALFPGSLIVEPIVPRNAT
jgi:hypothetical protein